MYKLVEVSQGWFHGRLEVPSIQLYIFAGGGNSPDLGRGHMLLEEEAGKGAHVQSFIQQQNLQTF